MKDKGKGLDTKGKDKIFDFFCADFVIKFKGELNGPFNNDWLKDKGGKDNESSFCCHVGCAVPQNLGQITRYANTILST